MPLKLIDPETDRRWDSFVEEHPLGTVYHLSNWKKVIESSFQHIKGKVIVLCNKSGQIEGGLPIYFVKSRLTGNRIVSAPFALYCDPLVPNQEIGAQLLTSLKELCKEQCADYFETRFSSINGLHSLPKVEYSTSNVMHVLKLDKTPANLLTTFRKNIVQSIARGNKNNLVMKHGNSKDDLRIFYQILLESRKRLGLPPIPFRFYDALWNAFKPNDQLELVFAFYKEMPIATKLFLKYKKTFFSEYGGDCLTYRGLCPNHFLEWEAIKLACSKGYMFYSFGRTSCNNKGLLFYKSRWGTEERQLPYLFYPRKIANRSKREQGLYYNLARRFFRYSPRFVSKIAGTILYGHMG